MRLWCACEGQIRQKPGFIVTEAESGNRDMNKERIKALLQLENHDTPLDYFMSTGEEVDPDEWEQIEVRDAEQHTLTEDDLHNALPPSMRLARSLPGDARRTSVHDTSIFKVRYKYSGNQEGQRTFCNRMLQEDKRYRFEDIDAAEHLAVNPGLGPHGSDTYSIWLFKGGRNCRHYWQRVIYLKKNNKMIGVNEARRMILELDPPDREAAKWKQNDPRVAQIASPSNNHWALPSNYKQTLNNTEMDKKERIALALARAEQKFKLYDGRTKIGVVGYPRIGGPAFAYTDEGERIPLPEGEHEIDTGEVLVIDANGLYQGMKKSQSGMKLSDFHEDGMRVYDAVYDGSDGTGVYAISCVENPAMEDVWVALKKHPQRMQLTANSQKPKGKYAAMVKEVFDEVFNRQEPEPEDLASRVLKSLQMKKQELPLDNSPEGKRERLMAAIVNAKKSR